MVCQTGLDRRKPIRTQQKEIVRDIDIPFKYELIYKQKHECSLKVMNLCKYPTDDCSNISGYVIKVNEPITNGDYRMIKWLTGYMIDNTFSKEESLSINWLNVK